ncbi:hypothetical protein N2152v2_010242 [Parachlorella kessleri]
MPAAAPQLARGPQLPPKVALMFLTRGPMPLEPVWRAFLSAPGLAWPAPPATEGSQDNSSGGSQDSSSGSSSTAGSSVGPLFSMYVHCPPGFEYPEGSLFAGHEIPERVLVRWGQSTELLAEVLLVQAALGDPLNQRFVLLSESCIPLYPVATVYAQLMSEGRSRVNTCPAGDPKDKEQWQQGMQDFGLPEGSWRKSSQWKFLTRRHAELVVRDKLLIAAFHQECRVNHSRWCLSAEHYIPTLLAHLGLGNETLCERLTYDEWGWEPHPKTFLGDEASNATLRAMRGDSCEDQHTAVSALAAAAVHRLSQGQQQEGQAWPSSREAGAARAAGAQTSSQLGGVLDQGQVLPASCPLFARKIAGQGAGQWAYVLAPMLAGEQP